MKQEVGVTLLVQNKKSIYFAIELSLSEISYVLDAHVLTCARKWREHRGGTLEMRNAILIP